jgi:Glycosyltransferase family 87
MSYSSVALSPPVKATLAGRLMAWVRAHLAFVAAAVVLALAWGGLLLTHRQTPLAVPRAAALHYAFADPATAKTLASLHWDRLDVTPMDTHYEVLAFYRGPAIVATVTVGSHDGQIFILDTTDLAAEKYEYGSSVADNATVLAVLSLAFILMSAVWPLWRLRNLDVLMLASLTLAVTFYNAGMLTRMAVIGYSCLLYLAVRCAWWGLKGPGAGPSVPLYDHLTRGWSDGQRLRTLRLLALAAAVIVAVVGLSSYNVIDVGFAVMEGATLILHGVLPYGHIPDVLHGDTYPIGSYLLYLPAAALSPVHNVWDDADLTLTVAVVAALLAGVGLWRIAGRAGGSSARTSGLRSAIAWLTFPPLLVTVSTGTSDVALAAILVGALVLWRRPGWSAAAVSGAAWFKAVPVAVLPLMLARLRGRELARAAAAVVLTSAIMVGVLVALGGVQAPAAMLSAMSFQFTRGSQHTLWSIIGSVPLQQLVEAATVALLVGAVIRIRRQQTLAEDPARIAALAAAVLIGLQLSLLGEHRAIARASR